MMVIFMMGSGEMDVDKGKVFIFRKKIIAIIKVIGKKIKNKEREFFNLVKNNTMMGFL
jgi:hypothetical protein